jgi:hypothetical protein
MALADSSLCRLKFNLHKEFAFIEHKKRPQMMQLVMQMLPNLWKFSTARRVKTVESFEEVAFEPATVLELEETTP